MAVTALGEPLVRVEPDAAEYVVGDMISPFKAALGVDYREFEQQLMAAIHIRFGLPPRCSEALATRIKKADRVAAYLEATQLAGFSVPEAERYFGRPRGLDGAGSQKFHRLKPLAPNDAEAIYLKTFRQLLGTP